MIYVCDEHTYFSLLPPPPNLQTLIRGNLGLSGRLYGCGLPFVDLWCHWCHGEGAGRRWDLNCPIALNSIFLKLNVGSLEAETSAIIWFLCYDIWNLHPASANRISTTEKITVMNIETKIVKYSSNYGFSYDIFRLAQVFNCEIGKKKTLKSFFFFPSSMWASCSSQRSLSCEPVIMFGFGSYSSLSPDPLPPLRSLPPPLLFTSSRRQIKWYIIHLQSPISPHHLLSASFIILIEPGVIENVLTTERKRLLFINLSKMRIEISINNMVCFLIVWSYSQYKNKKVRNGQPLISSLLHLCILNF